ncbi:MAG: hypothetical protein ACYTEG_01595 [Planctomycetota bacterium]|jgi:GGDEF domain-containing protein
MSNERKKKNPADETQTEFDLPVDGTNPPAPNDEPELEVNLPQPGEQDTDTSPEISDDTETTPKPVEIGEPFADDSDASTRTDLDSDPRAIDPATSGSEELEVRLERDDDPPTATSGLDPEPPTETSIIEGQTQTEFGFLTEPEPELEGPSTRTDLAPEGVDLLKALSRNADETHTQRDDPTQTNLFEDDPDTEDVEEGPDARTRELAAPDGTTADLDETKSLSDQLTIDLGDEASTGDLAPPTRAPEEPRFEAIHVEVPDGTFIDTFFERSDDEDDEDDTHGVTPTRRRWRDRLERAEPSPWRDLGLWFVHRLDPRPWLSKLRTRRRRTSGEEPSNKQVAKDAARAIVGLVATVVKPRAEISAEHNKAWWRRTIVEIAALFLIVVPVELSLTGSIGSFESHPHPYWLIVIPMACARGVVAGLLAAGIASMLYAAGALAALDDKVLSEIFEFEHMLEPILFFIVGFFCGELHDELASRFRRLDRRMDDVQDRNQSLRQERDVLRDANRELEKRIVDASVQFGNLIVAAERIENSGRTEVFEIALELVEEHCGAAASVMLLLEDGTLDYICARGWPEEETADRIAAARESRLVRMAIADGRTVNGFSEEEEPPPTGPLVVAPLFDKSGLVKAMLSLDEIPSTRLNESTITTFLGIANWIGAALSRIAVAQRAESQPTALPGVPAMPLGTVEELGDRLRLELERCARYGVPTSFLAIQLSSWSDATRDGRAAADRFVAEQFTTGLRPSDNIYRFGYPGCYLLVLAGTDSAGAEVVRSRLLRRVEFVAAQAVGPVDIFATGPDADAPDLVSLADRVAQRFRAQSQLPLEGACPIQVPERGEPGTRAELLLRLRMEVSLAARRESDLHVVGFRTNVRDVAVGVTLARHLSEVGARLLRATDGVYLASENCTAVVMPVTGAEEAETLARRIVQALRDRDPHAPYGALETSVVALDSAHPDVASILNSIGVSQTPEGSA